LSTSPFLHLLFGGSKRAQRLLPSELQLAGHQPIVWVDSIVLPPGQIPFVSQALQFALLAPVNLASALHAEPHRLLIGVDIGPRHGIEK
jgi:hypothetical protein